jgi:RsiW-degrading membrane proteinase PrsW (M82 family)
MPFFVSLLCGVLPMLFFAWILFKLDRFEKEPFSLLLAVFGWGAVVAAGGAFMINTVFGISLYALTGSEVTANLAVGSLVAPVVEESLKGFAVLLVFWIFFTEFDSLLDGIIYSGITALGFAAAENTFYIYNYGYLESGWPGISELTFIRVVLVGWQHPFYTAFIGMGVAWARLTQKPALNFLGPLLGWIAAVFSHSLHNTLHAFVSSGLGRAFATLLDWTGWFVLFVVIILAISRESAWLKKYLKQERKNGVITKTQYQTAVSARQQMFTRVRARFNNRYRKTKRFYQLCGELALKKHQFQTYGDERGNEEIIQTLREELAALSPQVKAES